MDREEKNQFSDDVEQGMKAAMSDPSYWARRRQRWDEWGSPVGLGLAWLLFLGSIGLFVYLLHLSELF